LDPEEQKLHHQINLLMSRLDEQQRRWFAALESHNVGHGGDTLLSLITGLHVDTIRRGREELDADLSGRPADRVRKPGAGRPPGKKKDPQALEALKTLAEPATGGDPMTQDKFVRRSLRTLSDEMDALGLGVCPTTIAEMLHDLGYNLRVNVKRITGPYHPDRDRQFRYIESLIEEFRAEGLPILSVDSKKKELVGNFCNAGQTWVELPYEVNAHDFPSDALCKAVPYGLYDLLANRGHVVVGSSADTPAFAVDAVVRWWVRCGCKRYRDAGELLILADSGGSNGCRPRQWKHQLQLLMADAYGLNVTVCHYPRGASKWNPVEHRLFSQISRNWSGIPLRTPELMLSLLRGTETRTGLKVTAEWTGYRYQRGTTVTNAQMEELNIERHGPCPQWNYTIKPRGQEGFNWN
jgi:hypothetical protein